MNKRHAFILLVGITVCALSLWYRSNQKLRVVPLKGTQSHQASTKNNFHDTTWNSPVLDATPPPQPQPQEPSSAIENESVFTFTAESDLDTFLGALEDAGIQTDAVIRELRSVKLSANRSQTAIAKQLAGNRAALDNNYTILTPYPVLPDSTFEGEAFEENALPYLGVPMDNASWGEGTTIAILDTGVLAHETLNGVSIKHIDLIASDESDPKSYASHGTAVASLIAGQSGNGISPSVDLISIRVLDSDGIGDTFTLAHGIVEAVDQGADIINMSLGGFGDSSVLNAAINYATENNVVLIAATGNEGQGVLPYPAAYDSVISVSAIDATNQHASFANQAEGVDIAAPGVGITAAWENEQWVSFTGTSASTPYVSGAIAAILSQTDSSTANDAANTLLQNANDTGYPGPDPQTGRGVIDLQRALYNSNDKVTDLALASIHIDPIAMPDGGTKIYVTAQNRGTQSIPNANLTIAVGGNISQPAYLGPLESGEIKTHELIIHSGQLQSLDPLSIEAIAVIPYGTPDSKEANNEQTIVIERPEP